MNVSTMPGVKRGALIIALASSSLVISSCASAPESPQGSAQVRSKLTALQSDQNLAGRARVEFREAETAVRMAEQPLTDADAALGRHRVYLADRKVSIAEAKAATRYAEAQRQQLGEQRDAARLRARTDEVGTARAETERARNAAAEARAATDRARSAATEARDAAEAARRVEDEKAAAAATLRAEAYQRQIDALQAEVTDRGVVLTLGDVLFATGSAQLEGGANRNLDKLVSFLNQYPERRVQIEGHTDNVGSGAYNQGLSQRRADSVSDYLTEQGIASQRLSAAGIGMDRPVASNDTGAGRQQNRRVEIIIENPAQP